MCLPRMNFVSEGGNSSVLKVRKKVVPGSSKKKFVSEAPILLVSQS